MLDTIGEPLDPDSGKHPGQGSNGGLTVLVNTVSSHNSSGCWYRQGYPWCQSGIGSLWSLRLCRLYRQPKEGCWLTWLATSRVSSSNVSHHEQRWTLSRTVSRRKNTFETSLSDTSISLNNAACFESPAVVLKGLISTLYGPYFGTIPHAPECNAFVKYLLFIFIAKFFCNLAIMVTDYLVTLGSIGVISSLGIWSYTSHGHPYFIPSPFKQFLLRCTVSADFRYFTAGATREVGQRGELLAGWADSRLRLHRTGAAELVLS